MVKIGQVRPKCAESGLNAGISKIKTRQAKAFGSFAEIDIYG